MTNARALAAVAFLVPCAAAAQSALALRLGFAHSVGEVAADLPMSDVVIGQVPVELDLLWRFGRLAAGAYGSYGFGLAGGCAADASCGASSVRLGALATMAFSSPWRSIGAWAGAGAGFEWTARTTERSGVETWGYRGAEVLSLQGGMDLSLGRRVALGPFVLLALGRYSTVSLDTPVESSTAEIAGKRFHAWLELGVRGTVELGAAR